MNIEETIPNLIAGLEIKYRDVKIKTNLISLLWRVALIGGIVGILGLSLYEMVALNLSMAEFLFDKKRLSLLFLLLFFFFGFYLVHIYRKNSLESAEQDYARKTKLLTKLKSHQDYYQRGQFLQENKYYELAHDDFSKAIEELCRESEELSEKLARFFDEYMKLPKYVEGFPRPVPDFQNHNLGMYLQYYWARKTNLERLERLDEAKEDEEKIRIARILEEDNHELTAKYWKEYVD